MAIDDDLIENTELVAVVINPGSLMTNDATMNSQVNVMIGDNDGV